MSYSEIPLVTPNWIENKEFPHSMPSTENLRIQYETFRKSGIIDILQFAQSVIPGSELSWSPTQGFFNEGLSPGFELKGRQHTERSQRTVARYEGVRPEKGYEYVTKSIKVGSSRGGIDLFCFLKVDGFVFDDPEIDDRPFQGLSYGSPLDKHVPAGQLADLEVKLFDLIYTFSMVPSQDKLKYREALIKSGKPLIA